MASISQTTGGAPLWTRPERAPRIDAIWSSSVERLKHPLDGMLDAGKGKVPLVAQEDPQEVLTE